MLRFAAKKIFESKKMSLITIAGITFAMVILIVSIYRVYVSKEIEKAQFNKFAGEKRLQYNELTLYAQQYYVNDFGDTIQDEFEFDYGVIEKLKSMKEVAGLRAAYFDFMDTYSIFLENTKYEKVHVNAVDPKYDTFDKSLTQLYNDSSPIIAGRVFQEGDFDSCLIGEITLIETAYSPQEIIGKTVEISGYPNPVTIIGVFSNNYSEEYWANDIEARKQHILEYGVSRNTGDFLFSIDVIKALKPEKRIPNRVSLTLKDFNDMKRIHETIRKAYNISGYSDYFSSYLRVMETTAYARLLIFLGTVTLFVCLLLLSVTVAINVDNQQSTVQLLRILGEKKYKIVLLVLYETLILSAIGIFLGLFIGYIITTSIAVGYAKLLAGMINTKIFIIPGKLLLILGVLNLLFTAMIGIAFGGIAVKSQKEVKLYEE